MSRPERGDPSCDDGLTGSNGQPRPASESADISSEFPQNSPESALPKTSKKRKAEDEEPRFSTAKRIERFYNEGYRKLYNSTIEVYSSSYSSAGHVSQPFSTSQIGSTVWTKTEKDLFFNLLPRKGRHDIGGIATELVTKSEPEIVQYLGLLQKGLMDAELAHYRPWFVDKPNFDAADEISPECVSILDRAGDALAARQYKEDERNEHAKRGEMWMLTPTIGGWVDDRLRRGRNSKLEVSLILPAANLLNLKSFLWLSKRFFMNSSDLEYNWSSYAETPRCPTIMYSAFSDFHTLAIDITKRLVRSVLHCAMSRLRAENSLAVKRRRLIDRRDVFAAIDILEMRRSVAPYWSGVPRRCKLRVFEDGKIVTFTGKEYSYDAVEEILNKGGHADEEKSAAISVVDEDMDDMDEIDGTSSHHQSESDLEAEPEEEVVGKEGGGGGDSFLDTAHPPSENDDEVSLSEGELQEELQDENLELLDQRQSRAEEADLWKLLGEDIAQKQDLAHRDGELKFLSAARKERKELVDWTSWIDYAAEWETYHSAIPALSFDDPK